MSVLTSAGITRVPHYAPLHYLPFIARSRKLMSKPSLSKEGFPSTHFRSMSRNQDVSRGFLEHTFLTLENSPKILKAKLEAGFPHIGIFVPSIAIESIRFDLCRFNVAMTRQLRRGDKKGFPESDTNGRYYGARQIPVARSNPDKKSMLEFHLPAGTMIEVLIHGDLDLPSSTEIVCFDENDSSLSKMILASLDVKWKVRTEEPPGPYPRKKSYADQVRGFLDRALKDPNWRGDGLEFDRV